MRSRVVSIATLFLASVCASPANAYRTNEELPELMSSGPAIWSSRVVPFHLAEPGVPGMTFGRSWNAVNDAMNSWEGHDCSDLDFRLSAASASPVSGDGINTVAWVPSGLAVFGALPDSVGFADIRYAATGMGDYQIIEADIYFDGSHAQWTDGAATAEDLKRSIQASVAHELGHALGLLHPCEQGGTGGAPNCYEDPSYIEATLYPVYTGSEQASLSQDDILGLCDLYPRPSCTIKCAADQLCSGNKCLTICGSDTCSPEEICISGQCSPSSCTGALCYMCAHHEDCDYGSECVDGYCVVNGLSPLADPCDDNDSCSSGFCLDAYCTVSCAAGGICPMMFECREEDDLCEAAAGTFGAQCRYGYECVSNKCLIEADGLGACTRICTISTPCPSGYVCAIVSGKEVCRPTQSSGGCNIASNRSNSQIPITFILSILLLLVRTLPPRTVSSHKRIKR
jgi:hypothetical protein